MASLKEIKNRISTVGTTRKITQARQMVSSAHLHRAQGILQYARGYLTQLQSLQILQTQQTSQSFPITSPFAPPLLAIAPGTIAVVVAGSNAGMCGSFNARIEKQMLQTAASMKGENLLFYPVGAKIRAAIIRAGYPVAGNFDHLSSKPTLPEATALSHELISGFLSGKFSRVALLYHDFHTIGTQAVVTHPLLPIPSIPPASSTPSPAVMPETDYIIEPTPEALSQTLLPLLVNATIWAALTSSAASEHAARTIAMQLATDNADDLLDDLKLSYNKLRQQNITAELLDIIGSSFA